MRVRAALRLEARLSRTVSYGELAVQTLCLAKAQIPADMDGHVNEHFLKIFHFITALELSAYRSVGFMLSWFA